ncbi:hypothetical protein D3C80_1313790 [compost metagenome]
MAGITLRHCRAGQLIRIRQVQLAEHLLERLSDLPVEQVLLVLAPLPACVQVQRMRNVQLRLCSNHRFFARRSGKRTRIRLEVAERRSAAQDKGPQQRCQHRITAERADLLQREAAAGFH